MRMYIGLFTVSMILSTLAFAQPSGAVQTGDTRGQVTAGERRNVDLTVYNQNLALIREERLVPLPSGFRRVVIPDIPATIDGTSLHFRSLTDASAVRVLEQNYQYDLVHPAKLLDRYLGKDVEFVRYDEATKKEYMVTGRLLSTGYVFQPGYPGGTPSYTYSGAMIAEVNGKIEVNPAGRLVLPALPGGLILRPQLEWLVEGKQDGNHMTEISYLASGLSWSCDYVALLDEKDAHVDLTGWVTLANGSGSSFKDASLKLVAGDVNIVRREMDMKLAAGGLKDAEELSQPQFRQTELFEYKLYTMQRRTDVNNNETKQIELVSGNDVDAKKVFVYDGLQDQWRSRYANGSYRSQQTFGQVSNPKVGVFVTFKNEKSAGLGIPLPQGRVRVYKRDQDGKEQFVGEDKIDHTPKDEAVRLYLGNAFDIVGERAQKNFRTMANGHVIEETIGISVRNHKDSPVTVLVTEHPWRWSQWEIVRADAEWNKIDQTTIQFPVTIDGNGSETISYTIRYSW